jgi:hypothetical protein
MTNKFISFAVASALTLVIAAPANAASKKSTRAASAAAAKPATVSAEEFNALKAQLEALQGRLSQIEQQQQAQTAAVTDATKAVVAQQAATTDLQDSIDRTSDNLAKTAANVGEWVGRFQWKGDMRYRNETIDQQYISGTRNRDRIRLRAGFFAKVNDTVRVEVQMTTTEHTLTAANGDPRSSNQTLTDSNSRKALDLDTAYAEWQPNAMWKVTAGKMRYPWVRPGQSVLFDADINPEGVAVNFTNPTPGGVFASAFYTQLTERNAAAALIGQTSLADSNMVGAQMGWRSNPAQPTKFMVGVGYFNYGAVKGYNPFYDGNAFGNTTTTSAAVCRKGIATCLAGGYSIVEGIGEFATVLGGYPFTAYADYIKNTDAITAYDQAYSVGVMLGRASNPRSWEFGVAYQKVEKDSQFGQYVDSDFGAGNTDAKGFMLKGAYQFAKNWRVNGTYFINTTNNDVGTAISGVGTVFDRDYKRLQLDLNMTF